MVHTITTRPAIHKKYFFMVCFIAAMGGFLFGFDTAVISGALPFVVKDFALDSLMEGWFVSSALLGCIIGVAFSGKLSDIIGRKNVMIISAGLFFVSAIGCMLAGNIFWLISYRLVGGLGIGVASMICPLYISEIAPSHFRGRMVALYQLAITIGIVTAYFSNAYLVKLSGDHSFTGWLDYIIEEDIWRSMIGIGLLPSVLFWAGLFFIPESPRWLVLKGRDKKGYNTLLKIDPISAGKEMSAIQQSMQEEKGSLRQLLSPVYRTALIIGVTLPFLTQVSGINAVIYYGPSILDKAGFSLGDAFGGQVTIGLVNVIFTFVAIFTVDKWGRKPLLILGISLAVFALLFIGFLFYANVTEGPWILIFILLFIASFAFSFGPVCFIIISEIFPNKVRAQAVSLATLALWIGNFFVGQLTPIMLKSPGWGPAATFWTFAVLCAPALYITINFIPETMGKSLEEIEAFWKTKYASKNYVTKVN
ncbi:MAG: sugar porter family MFS transporter [Chitinophagaceae bacterium]|nr:sugar porter family MFS transporter [Chitinophagaceae bacterium]